MVESIEQHTTGRLGETQPRHVRVVLRYRTDDPYAVGLCFPGPAHLTATLVVADGGAPDDGVRWTVGRDLLAEGRRHGAGTGDVRVRPDEPDGVLLEWHAPGGGVQVVRFGAADLAAFLENTFRLVPSGTESGRVDWPCTAHDFLQRIF